MNEQTKVKLKYTVIFVLVIGAILMVLFKFDQVLKAARYVVSLMSPLIVGCVLAFVVNVPMRGYEKLLHRMQRKCKKKLKRRAVEAISLVLAVVSFVLVLFLVFRMIGPRLVDSVIGIYNTILQKYPLALAWLEKYGIETDSIRKLLDQVNFEKLLTTLQNNAKNIFDTISLAASSIAGALVNAVTGIVMAIYILANKRTLTSQLKRLLYAYFKKSAADRVCEIAKLCNTTFSNFISGQGIECLILCIMFLVVLSIMNFPYAAVISILIAALAIIPYIGSFAGCAIGALLILMVEPGKVIWFIIVFLVIQQIENQLIYPKVVGKSVGLPPMWTLLAALLGGKMFGILGLLCFIPVVSVIYTLLQTNMRRRLKFKKIKITADNDLVECGNAGAAPEEQPEKPSQESEEK